MGSDRRSSSRKQYQTNQERGDPHKSSTRKKLHGTIHDLDNVDFTSSNVHSSHKEAMLCIFEDNEAVIKMIIDMFSEPTELLLIGCSIESIWTPKFQIKYIDTKNQLADMLTKRNFTRDEWNHLLCLFNISHFSSAECSEVMSKRTQKESGEERVTEKSRPMMNLVARCSERASAALSSTASEKPRENQTRKQNPLSPKIEKYDRTGRPVVCSQQADQVVIENDETNSYTEAESELSLGSRSFLHRVNDQVRKRQKQSSKDATKDSDKHSVMWRMLSSTLESSVFMDKNYSDKWHSIKNTEDLAKKQMFDISEKLITEQSDTIYGVNTINWENSSWKHFVFDW